MLRIRTHGRFSFFRVGSSRGGLHLLGRSRGSAHAFPLLLALGGSDRQAVNGNPSLMRYDRSEPGHIDAGLPRISPWCWKSCYPLLRVSIFVDTTCSRCSYTSHWAIWPCDVVATELAWHPISDEIHRSELGHIDAGDYRQRAAALEGRVSKVLPLFGELRSI